MTNDQRPNDERGAIPHSSFVVRHCGGPLTPTLIPPGYREARGQGDWYAGVIAVVALLVRLCSFLPAASAQEQSKPTPTEKPAAGRGGSDPRNSIFRTTVPEHPFDIILGRPTRDSVTASVLVYADAEARVVYGTHPGGPYPSQTPPVWLKKDEPNHIRIAGLKADTRYVYRLEYRAPHAVTPFVRSDEFAFHTARPPGSAFVFTVQADSHLDFSTIPQIYAKTLTNALADGPDFHFELGDTFMTDKYPKYTDAAPQYVAQRYYFGLLCHSAPLFFVLGNHDGESGMRRGGGRGRGGGGGGGDDGMAAWSNQMRKRYLPNPAPDGFYTGNPQADPNGGRLEDYYAWEWGDALFVVLDPFWYTTGKARVDEGNWNRTLGREQYDWLKRTLETSKSRFKFLFIHHLVGGFDKEGRGGSEAAPLYEWGGKSVSGDIEFATRRPGWGAPIHDLLVKHHATAVFHGHDHLYARQELDGIVYVEVPQPSHPESGTRSAAEYGYTHGTILPSPGHVRVRISREQGAIEYVRSRQPSEEAMNRRNGEVADAVTIKSP